MQLTVLRLGDNGDTTVGAFYIDGVLKCGTIEDQEQKGDKVKHETRVPEGTYKVGLRAAGGFHNRYSRKFPDIHKGMLCIYNQDNWKLVENGKTFQYILIHLGNHDDNTSGCLLLNYGIDTGRYRGSRSGDAYKAIYPEIAEAIEKGEEVTMTYIDVEPGR